MDDTVGLCKATVADITRIPQIEDVTVSFVHEYIHFLQLIGSIPGARMLGELIDLGVKSAVVLSGKIPESGGTLDSNVDVRALLREQPKAALSALDMRVRADSLLDECAVQFGNSAYPKQSGTDTWSLGFQNVAKRTYNLDMHGFVTPQGQFRPFTPGFLAENMARCIDRWIAKNHSFKHNWPSNNSEAEHYRGLTEILKQKPYEKNVHPSIVERVAVVICSLALQTRRPDQATVSMLSCLSGGPYLGGMLVSIAMELQKRLRTENLLLAENYTAVLGEIQTGAAGPMIAAERFRIFEQLELIAKAATCLLNDPAYFANDTITWKDVLVWMSRHSVPPVIAMDGQVKDIAGIKVTSNVSDFLLEVERVCLDR